jgi:hypothetical protein
MKKKEVTKYIQKNKWMDKRGLKVAVKPFGQKTKEKNRINVSKKREGAVFNLEQRI